MKRIILLTAAAVLCSTVNSFAVSPATESGKASPVKHPLPAPRSLEELKSAPLYTFNENEVDVYLKDLSKVEPDPIKRIVKLARQDLGEPYEIYLLGEGPIELYDPDPMYCLNKSDCVTFVERTYAMALSHDWPSFFKTLQRIRYKEGKVGMVTRNHETVADWDRNNAWLLEDVTKNLGGGKQWVELHMTWKPSKFFAKYNIGQDLPDVTLVDSYIPKDKIKDAIKDIKEGDMIEVVRGDPAGEQWVGHVGLAVFGPDKEVHFLNSTEPKVREQPLMDLATKQQKTIGMKVLRLKAQPQKLVDAQVK